MILLPDPAQSQGTNEERGRHVRAAKCHDA